MRIWGNPAASRAAALASACLLALATMPALARGTADALAREPADAPADDADDRGIVVTGTRLNAASAFESPVPVTMLGRDELSAAPATLAEALRVQPFVIPGGGPAAGGGTASVGQNFLNLRGLGNDRTLVLVNGRRYVPAGPSGLVDSNMIPEALVSRVDIVTGGASAAYGSDAVAGVVNFRLDDELRGLRLHAYSGLSQRGDNGEVKIAAAAGIAALGDRLHLTISGEHYDNDGVPGTARAFRRRAGGQIRNPAGTPVLIRASDVRTPYTLGGLVVTGGGNAANNALVSGLMFNPGGGTSPYDYGTSATTRLTANGTQDGGDGFRASTGQDVIRPLSRDLAFARATLRATDNLTIEAEGTWGKTRTVVTNSPNVATLTIQRANPFLAAAAPGLVSQMTALGVTRFTMNRLVFERGPTLLTSDNTVRRGLIGARLDLFGLEWSAAYQEARNTNRSRTDNNLIPANIARAVNAVADAGGGGPVCADLRSADPAVRAAAEGCVAFNPFGFGAPSDAALSYVSGTSRARARTTMRVFDAGVTGEAPFLAADPLSFAAGFSWRRLTSALVADARANAFGWRITNQTDFAGRQSVREGYAEVQLPLLRDLPLARSLDVNLAGRITDYATSGTVRTWKTGINWQPVAALRLRATRSRDIRAANLDELFATGRQSPNTLSDNLTNQTYNAVPVRTFGNRDLQPEIADSWVVGAAVQPARSLDLSVDYWSIGIEGAIRTLGAQQTVEQCNISNQASPICAFVTRDPVTRAITAVRSSPFNLSHQTARGIDFEANWRAPAGTFGLGEDDSLSLRLLGMLVLESRVRSALVANPVNDAGNLIAQSAVTGSAINSLPRLRINGQVNWRRGPLGVRLLARYIDKFTWDKSKVLGVDTDFNRIPAQVYLDGEFSVRPSIAAREVELYLNVQNLLDHQPPYSPVPGNATPLPSQPVLYDQVGRMFRVGVRVEI